MVITNGDSLFGTVLDDVNKMVLKMNVGDSLTFGKFVPSSDYAVESLYSGT